MTQAEANSKFTLAVNRVLKQIERNKTLFDDYKEGENEDCSTSNADDAVLCLDDFIEELQGARDDFQSIIDEDIEDEYEEEDGNIPGTGDDEEYQDTADLRPSDADIKEAEGEHNDE